MTLLDLHPNANLEYCYFKLNCGPVALLVDWIAKRRVGEYLLRVSVHSTTLRDVRFVRIGSFMPGDRYLKLDRTIGYADDVSWDLRIDPGIERMRPDIFPAALMRMPDLSSVSAPCARFTGWINIGNVITEVNAVSGLVSHYWGRSLAREWWWISAHQFDQPDTAIECCVLKTRAWGLPVSLPISYLYLKAEGRTQAMTLPIHFGRVKGSPERFTVTMLPFGRQRIILKCVGRDYGDFGDHIINTLVGDLEIWRGDRRIAVAKGTAGLERLGFGAIPKR